MLRDQLIAALDATVANKVVLVAGQPNMPVSDVVDTPRAIILWPSLIDEEEESLLSIDVMQDENDEWRLVVFDKLNKRTMIIGVPYKDLLEAEAMWLKILQEIDTFTEAFAKGPESLNQFLSQLEQ